MSEEVAPKTAISYRRDDASGWARSLYDRLIVSFGKDHVFIDFDGIGSGDDFEAAILRTIDTSDALLALIGRRWLDAASKDGKPRLDDPHDIVRMEIRAGLAKGLVIPVLVEGASMPSGSVLPADIEKLSRLNAHVIGLKTFPQDADDLAQEIRLRARLAREQKESVSPAARIHALEEALAQAKAELDAVRRTQPRPARPRRPFDAYLVYSHKDSARWAAIIHRALETYPAVNGRRLRVFRDTTDLVASPTLASNVHEIVDNSEFVILLASPAAAHSRWVEAELSHFLESRSREQVLVVLLEGEPQLSMPPSLAAVREEMLVVDFRGIDDHIGAVRDSTFRAGIASLVAVLWGVTRDEVVARDARRNRQRFAFMAAVIVLATAVTFLAWFLSA